MAYMGSNTEHTNTGHMDPSTNVAATIRKRVDISIASSVAILCQNLLASYLTSYLILIIIINTFQKIIDTPYIIRKSKSGENLS